MVFLVSLMVWARPTLVVLRSVTVLLRLETASALAETLELRLSALADALAAAAWRPGPPAERPRASRPYRRSAA